MSEHLMFSLKTKDKSVAIKLDKVNDVTVRYMLDYIGVAVSDLFGPDACESLLFDDGGMFVVSDEATDDVDLMTFEFQPIFEHASTEELINVLYSSPKRPTMLSMNYFRAGILSTLLTMTTDEHIEDVIEPLINKGWTCHAHDSI